MKYQANVLFISLLSLSGIMTIILLLLTQFTEQENITQYEYQIYLSDKFKLVKKITQDPQQQCQQQKQEKITQKQGNIQYQFYCQRKTIFIRPKPTKDKYISIENISDWLDIDSYAQQIYYINHLNELPPSSEQDPQIVIANQTIDQKLEKNFYGIIITRHYFNFSGKKIYGVLYSSFDNQREERNLSFKKKVIENIETKYSRWSYLPFSKNLLGDE